MGIVLNEGSWASQMFASFWEHFKEALIPGGDIGEEINNGILQVKNYFTLGGQEFILTDATIVSFIAIFIAIVLFAVACRKREMIPGKGQMIVETLVDLIIGAAMSFGLNRKQAEEITPVIGTFGIVIMSCNVISWFHVSPPTKNIAFPIALALTAIIYVIGVSIKFVGIKGFFGSLTTPMAAMLPFKILDFIIRPISLALRLFGNVFGAFVFMEFLNIATPILLPGVFSLWFDLIDGILQAVVFSYLLMSYIGESVEGAEESKMLKAEKAEKKRKKLEEKQKQAAENAAA